MKSKYLLINLKEKILFKYPKINSLKNNTNYMTMID